MLAISQTSSKKTTVNILPCRIEHNGPAKVTKRYWHPRPETDGSKIAYFRGRRMKGRAAKIPEAYEGLVLKSSDKTILDPVLPAEDDEEPELPESVKVVEQVAKFDEVTVWGHDQLPPADDQFVKGVEEWIAFAEAIHSR